MRTSVSRLLLLGLLLLGVLMLSCSSASEEEDNSSDDDSSGSPELASTCGTVAELARQNPVPEGAAEFVDVDVITSDLVIIERTVGDQAGNQQLVKLHGITSTGTLAVAANAGAALLRSETRSGAYFVPAGTGCDVTVTGGGRGVLGQLYSRSGENLNEALIQIAAALPNADGCLGNELAACYTTLPVQEPVSSKVIDDFLWKPEAERDGKLVVLVNPSNVTVLVNGSETLNNTGPSNGRGTTARASRSGCAYGNNVRVEFFDSDGRRIRVQDGRDYVTVPSGCSRYEFVL